MDIRHPSRCWLAALLLALVILALMLGKRITSAEPSDRKTVDQIAAAYGALPLAFEPGPAGRRYTARASGGSVEITPDGAVLRPNGGRGREAQAIRMRLKGASPAKAIRGERQLPGKVHYLRGRDSRAWRTNVPTYSAVRCREVYPGIDAIYYGRGTELEYDFVAAPGSDPAAIRIQFEQTGQPRLQPNGDLLVACGGSEVRHRRPFVYQEKAGKHRVVAAAYELHGSPAGDAVEVGFRLGDYDRSRPLIIDPVLIYSTYFGGAGVELSRGAGIAVDATGNVYVTGDTDSPSLPGSGDHSGGGFRDAFVTKLNPTGTSVLYTTYLGGSDSDVARGIAVDVDGNACIVGETFSRDFPIANALQPVHGGVPFSDAFAAKLDATGGTLLYSTFLGGTTGSDMAAGVALDEAGNAWIAGATNASDFPVRSAVQPAPAGNFDVFVTGLSASGDQLLMSTYFGGSGKDQARGIAIGPGGDVSLCGSTDSDNFPLLKAVQAERDFSHDAFVVRLTAGGTALDFSTYLGGDGPDVATGIAADVLGSVAVTGYTGSLNFPTAHAYQSRSGGRGDAFVARFSASGQQLIYSTYLGGSGVENLATAEQGAIALDGDGSAYVTGLTASKNFPVLGALQKRLGGMSDAFSARISPDGASLLYSTYLGGKGEDGGHAIAIDSPGNAFVTGQTYSTNLPLRNPAQRSAAGGGDGFIAKLGNASAEITPVLVLSSKSLDFGTVTARGGGFAKLRLANGGRGRLFYSVSDPEAPFNLLVGGGQGNLKPGKSKTLYIQFKPTAPGEYRGTVVIETNDPYFPTAQIELRGVLAEEP